MSFSGALDALVSCLLSGPGETTPDDRRQVESFAAGTAGRKDAATDVPDALRTWVQKVARHAYKTIDDEVDELKAAGYSEDQIFELTIATALGAARGRYESAMAVLADDAEGT